MPPNPTTTVMAWAMPRCRPIGYHPEMPDDDIARKRSLLTTALVGALLPRAVPEGRMLRAWLSTWAGIGHVAVGMARQDYDPKLTRYGNEGWWATFFLAGREHSIARDTASSWEQTPWRAVQASRP
jgi:hypothetical protein